MVDTGVRLKTSPWKRMVPKNGPCLCLHQQSGRTNNWTRVPKQHLNPKGDRARMEGICLLQIPNSSRKTQWEKPVGSREKRREAAACIQTDRDALRRDDVKRWSGFRCEDRGGSRARRPHARPTPQTATRGCPSTSPASAGWEHVLVSTSSLWERSQS